HTRRNLSDTRRDGILRTLHSHLQPCRSNLQCVSSDANHRQKSTGSRLLDKHGDGFELLGNRSALQHGHEEMGVV
ncbi:hypothetical protein PFISCL1PPCAC_17022, partial [Pristionchus fissidentatus]